MDDDQGWEDLIDPEFRDYYEGGGDDDYKDPYEDYGYDIEDDYKGFGPGEEDPDAPERKATYKEQQSTKFGALDKGLRIDVPKGRGRMTRTPEEAASEQIRGVFTDGEYNNLNKKTQNAVHDMLMNYKNVTVSNIPVLVAAGVWINKNPGKEYPTNKKEFDTFIKKYASGENPIDIVRYIRSITKTGKSPTGKSSTGKSSTNL